MWKLFRATQCLSVESGPLNWLNELECKPVFDVDKECRKIPKISPEAYIFQRPFFKGLIYGSLYLEGLIHRGAYFRNFTVVPHDSQLRRKDETAAFKMQFNKAKSMED